MTARLLDDRAIAIPAAVLLAAAVAYLSTLSPLAAFAALGAVLLCVFVLTRPEWILLLMVAALPWEGMLAYPSETLTVVKLLGVVLLVAVLLMTVGGRTRLYAPFTVVAVAVFLLISAISLIVSPDPSAGAGKLFRYALFAGFFFLVIQLVKDAAGLHRVLRVVALSATAAALWGLVGFLSGASERASGPIEDPNDFGYLMATIIPLAGYMIVADGRWRRLWVAALPILLAGMLATLSRGVIVALLALVVWAMITRRVRLGGMIVSTAALVTVIGVGLLLFSPLIEERLEQKGKAAEANVSSREALWRGAVLMAMDNPAFGVGPDRYGEESTEYVRDNPVVLESPAVHNSYLEILAENGAFALAAFLAFLIGAWVSVSSCYRSSRASGDRRGAALASATQASLLVAVAGAMFLSQQVAIPFWLIGALAAVVPRVLDEGRHRPAPQGGDVVGRPAALPGAA